MPLSLASALSGPCFPSLGQMGQRKNKIGDPGEPRSGLYPPWPGDFASAFAACATSSQVRVQSLRGLTLVPASGCSGGGPCKVRTVVGCPELTDGGAPKQCDCLQRGKEMNRHFRGESGGPCAQRCQSLSQHRGKRCDMHVCVLWTYSLLGRRSSCVNGVVIVCCAT